MKISLSKRWLLSSALVPLGLLSATELKAQVMPYDTIRVFQGSPFVNNGVNISFNSSVQLEDTFKNQLSPLVSYYITGSMIIKSTGVLNNVSGSIGISGDLILEPNGKLINNGNIYVFGNIINHSAMPLDAAVIGNGTIYLVGSKTPIVDTGFFNDARTTMANPTQTISGSQPFVAYNLVVNNNAGADPTKNVDSQVVLKQSLIVMNKLTLEKGIISTPNGAANPLILQPNVTIAGASDAGHVKGIIRVKGLGTVTLPVGSGSRYRKIAANITSNTLGLDAEYKAGDAGAGTFSGGFDPTLLQVYLNNEYWNLNPVSGGTAGGTVRVFWDGVSKPRIGSMGDVRVAHKVGGNWQNQGAAATTGDTLIGSVTSSPLTAGGSFTLGSINVGQSPLPVILADFNAKKQQGNNVLVTWNVSTEKDMAGYAIERSDNNGAFNRIGYVAANNAADYQYPDNNVPSGKLAYRLRMEEKSDASSYSKIALVNIADKESEFQVYPNPVTSQFKINIGGAARTVSVNLYNALGQLVYTSNVNLVAGANTISVNRPGNCVAGIYKLQIAGKADDELHTASITFK